MPIFNKGKGANHIRRQFAAGKLYRAIQTVLIAHASTRQIPSTNRLCSQTGACMACNAVVNGASSENSNLLSMSEG